MGVDNLESRVSRIERLESVRRISFFGVVIVLALTVLAILYANDFSVSRVAVGVIGATFALAFAVQYKKVKALLSGARECQGER